jgi:hypothetical protein
MKMIILAACCLTSSLSSAQTPISFYTFRTPSGDVQQHFFITPENGSLTLAVFGFNHPHPTLELDYAIGKPVHLGKNWSIAPALSIEYEGKPLDAGLFTFTKGQIGKFYLSLPAYIRVNLSTNRPVLLIPSGRIGYSFSLTTSFGLESKFKYGNGANISMLGGFIETKQKGNWVRLSYLGKITGGQNEFRFVFGTSF